MPSIKIRENEYFDSALRRFKRACEKAGLTAEMRRHEFHEKKTWKRKRLKAQAVKRLLKKLSRDKAPPARGPKAGTKKKRDRKNDRRHSVAN